MTLQGSGQITFIDINTELRVGSPSTAEASMDTMTAAATGDSTITNVPDNTADWYSYTHGYSYSLSTLASGACGLTPTGSNTYYSTTAQGNIANGTILYSNAARTTFHTNTYARGSIVNYFWCNSSGVVSGFFSPCI